jgi:hypothetical protein
VGESDRHSLQQPLPRGGTATAEAVVLPRWLLEQREQQQQNQQHLLDGGGRQQEEKHAVWQPDGAANWWVRRP